MPTDVVMPQMGESITEGTITKWLKQVGEAVQRDEPLFEISTDKVDAEIPSPAAGVLKEIKIPEGTTVQINTVVCSIDEAGSAAPPSETAATPAADSATPAAVDTPAAQEPVPTSTDSPGTEITMPQMGESITEGTITKWLRKVGDTVQRDEPIFEISTDKVDAEIPSPVAGKLTEIKVPEGTTVQINTVVAVIGGGAAKPASAPRALGNFRTGSDPYRLALSIRVPGRSHCLLAARAQNCKRQQRRPITAIGNRCLRSHHQGRHRRPPRGGSKARTDQSVRDRALAAVGDLFADHPCFSIRSPVVPCYNRSRQGRRPDSPARRACSDDEDALHHRETHG